LCLTTLISRAARGSAAEGIGGRPQGDRGGGREQPTTGCRASGAHAAAHRDKRGCLAGCDDAGCGLLERGQRQGLHRSGHRCLHRHRPSAARAATAAAAGTTAQRCRCQNPHGPQTQKQAGIRDLRPALAEGFSEGVGDRGAGEWPDQGRPGPAALPVAGPGEGR